MDILVYAMKMELDGEEYYRQQAELNRGNGLYNVLIELANDERDHAQILEDKSRGLSYRSKISVKSSVKNVFDKLKDSKGDTKYSGQADVYREALDKEKQSMELYKKLSSESESDKDLFGFLIAQEEEHYHVLEEIIKIIERPNEWVESAEFGRREEY